MIHLDIFNKFARDISFSAVNAGFLTVLIGFTSSVIIVIDAANSLGASAAQAGSWILALCVGMAVVGLYYSLKLKAPIAVAWSTSGAAVIASSASGLGMAEAVGAFMVCGALIALSGWLRLFDKILELVPASIAAGMLAGVLLRYGLELFQAAESDVGLILVMLAIFVPTAKLAARYAVSLALLAGAAYAYMLGQFDLAGLDLAVARPVLVVPDFSVAAIIGMALPLFIVTMASQNLPGAAVLKGSEFKDTPISPIITSTGFMTVLLAPFGGYALNLATITAAICIGPEAHPTPQRRYIAGVFAAIFYGLAGLFGLILVQFFLALPAPLVAAFAGIALLGVLTKSFSDAMTDAQARLSSTITLLCTASGVSFASVSSAFWGIVVGLAVHFIVERPSRPRVSQQLVEHRQSVPKP